MMASNVYKMDYISLLYFRVKFTKWTTLSQIFFELKILYSGRSVLTMSKDDLSFNIQRNLFS